MYIAYKSQADFSFSGQKNDNNLKYNDFQISKPRPSSELRPAFLAFLANRNVMKNRVMSVIYEYVAG
ncbi:hypothetical protein KL86PLE_90721 [uncultured Pleomorphomonas sp.]|uniref:Uncharacterized protein n=1 Tax=uncultured Pleomorphomonas sp. TaxID=442121 RepID=A0A212LQS2_9HYPH|nr:hypothetical protein KL86PLE_90721 [uncultured Pleomorphomonas sp.]